MEILRKRIILVDDVHFHLLNTKNRLKKHYEIFPAQSSEILYDILSNIIPDLILLDINIPEVDGIEILKGLKENVIYAEIPVIIFSNHKNEKNIRKVMSLGAVDFITKPYDDSALIECIEKQLDPYKKEQDRPKVLVIDDSPTILREVNSVLRDQYIIFGLPTPETATETIVKIAPDLIVLDYIMPEVSGFEVIQIIKKIQGYEDTPIIFLTAEGTIENLSIAMSLGANDFVVKPIKPEIFKEKVNHHIANYRTLRQLRAYGEGI